MECPADSKGWVEALQRFFRKTKFSETKLSKNKEEALEAEATKRDLIFSSFSLLNHLPSLNFYVSLISSVLFRSLILSNRTTLLFCFELEHCDQLSVTERSDLNSKCCGNHQLSFLGRLFSSRSSSQVNVLMLY